MSIISLNLNVVLFGKRAIIKIDYRRHYCANNDESSSDVAKDTLFHNSS